VEGLNTSASRLGLVMQFGSSADLSRGPQTTERSGKVDSPVAKMRTFSSEVITRQSGGSCSLKMAIRLGQASTSAGPYLFGQSEPASLAHRSEQKSPVALHISHSSCGVQVRNPSLMAG
jgi:hypothetical protein